MNKSSLHLSDLMIFVRDVRDKQGTKRSVTVRSWSTVKDVKDQLQKLIHVPPSSQKLYFGPLIVSRKELPNYRSLYDAGIHKSGETLFFDISGAFHDKEKKFSSSKGEISSNDICICSSMLEDTPQPLRKIVDEARHGLLMGYKPELVLDGTGGTYFLHDAKRTKVAVFKPGDEEPFAANNPRGYVREHHQDSMREGIKPGESCMREVAAYLLDHDGFSGVPMTSLVEARHNSFNSNESSLVYLDGTTKGMLSFTPSSTSQIESKVGSLQEFVNAEYTLDDLSPSKLSVDEVHKIAILDIRLLNADRNGSNLLCRRKQDNCFELVPIDHGYCLRSVCDVSWFDWCWLEWSQMKEPLSEASKKFVESLDVEADVTVLKEKLNIGIKAINNFRASTYMLKVGVAMGLNLYDIACLCCRYDNEGTKQSELECIISVASELAKVAIDNGKWHHIAASKAIEEELQFLTVSHLSNISTILKPKSEVDSFANWSVPSRMLTCESEGSAEEFLDFKGDDCNKWAASVLVELGGDEESVESKSRSTSFGSNGSQDNSKLSTSPNGFWFVKPADVVDEENNWPLPNATTKSFQSERSKLFKDDSYLSVVSDDIDKKLRLSLEGEPTVAIIQNLSSLPQIRKQSSLGRSHSYTALSSRNTTESFSQVFRGFSIYDKTEDESSQLQKYDTSFIFLLIERKISMLSLSR